MGSEGKKSLVVICASLESGETQMQDPQKLYAELADRLAKAEFAKTRDQILIHFFFLKMHWALSNTLQ